MSNKKTIFSFALKALFFLGIAALVVQLYPSVRTQFNYTYHEGKPWSHDLITAEFDFPIYKSEAELQADSAEALSDYTPYFTRDAAVLGAQLQKLRLDRSEFSAEEYAFLVQKLTTVYQDGLILTDDQEVIDGCSQISVLDNKHNAHLENVEQLHTLRQAYDSIMRAAAEKDYDFRGFLHGYLEPNLHYEQEMSRNERNRLLSGVSKTKGMVQIGQRIIDRGEVVTPERLGLLDSMRRAYEEKEASTDQSYGSLMGEFLFASIFLLLFLIYLFLFRRTIFESWRDLLFLAFMMLLIIICASLVNSKTDQSVYIVPYALLPVVVRLFYDGRTALFCHWCTVILVSVLVPSSWEFVLVEVAAGMTAVSTLRHLMQRSQLATTAVSVAIVTMLVFTALQFTLGVHLRQIDSFNYVTLAVSALLILAAYGFIYLFERFFGLTSSISLVELTNVNSDFLIRFSEVAPGTFQHSMQVSSLAMEAANRVGANALLVRCGAMYHDIGKMAHPELFTENQGGGKNPLLEMPIEEAAACVLRHVSDGLVQARKENLPKPIVDFISMHHGKNKTKYFYNLWLKQHPGETPDEKLFTYPGPLPQTKETAILMMADGVEAASRSLTEYSPETLRQLVNRIIDGLMTDGQLRETPLSFRDVEVIKQCFTEKLLSIYHHRIAYPA